MASLGGMGAFFGAAAAGRGATLGARAATKSTVGESSEDKGLFGWLLGQLQRDQMLETDPILNKVEGKGGSGTTSRGQGTTSVAVPKKPGGFGGLFAKK